MFGHATSHDNHQSQWSTTSSQQYEHDQQHRIQQRQPQDTFEQYHHFQHPQTSIDLQNQQQPSQPYQYTLAHAPSVSPYDYSANVGSSINHFHSRSSSTSPSLQPVAATDYATLHQSQAPSGAAQQRRHHEQMASGDPPGSSHSAGSGSASSCESAVTAGPARHTKQDPVSEQPTTTLGGSVPVPSDAQSSSQASSLQASPLFDVPPGYRTMLSSDKRASIIEHETNEGGSSPARHNSMPSSTSSMLFSSSVAQSSSEPNPYQSHSRPAHHQYSASASSSSSSTLPSSSTYVNTPLPYYTSGVSYDQAYSQQHVYLQQPIQASPSTSMHGQSLYQTPSTTSSSSVSSDNQSQIRSQNRAPLDQARSVPFLSQIDIKGESNTQFVAPTPPSSAPATITTFAMSGASGNVGPTSRLTRGQSGTFKLEPSEDTFPNFGRTSISSSNTGMSTNPSSVAHSRSTSVSSIANSTFGPLSASASSSASSSFGEFSASTSTPRKSMRLSNLDRKALCQYAEANPRIKHEHIGNMFGVERSTVSKILKQRAKWFSSSGDLSSPLSPTSDRKPREPKVVRNKLGRHPEMEAQLIEWGKEQTRNKVIVTDEQVKNKALEIAEDLKIDVSVFKASTGWLENFKNRGKYHGGRFDLEALPSTLDQESPGPATGGEVNDCNTQGSPFGEDQTGQAAPFLAGDHLANRQEATESLSSPDISSMALTVYTSPHGTRRQKRSTFSSLSSSALSLPDLMEREEQHTADLQYSSSSVDLQSGRSSFSNLNMQPLTYGLRPQHQISTLDSADSSPFPSPTCSAGSDAEQKGATSMLPSPSGAAKYTSTPTQRTIYSASYTPQSGDLQFTGPYGSIPPSNRLQQAGINFNLSLNSSPSLLPQSSHHRPAIAARQQLDPLNPHYPFAQMPMAYNDHGLYIPQGLGERHGTTGYYHHDQHATTSLASSSGQASMPQTVYSAYSSNVGSPALSAQSTSQQQSPLQRSQTDPMPLYSSMSLAEGYQTVSDDNLSGAGDSTITQSGGLENEPADSAYMDVDPMLAYSYGVPTATQEGQQYSDAAHSFKNPGMPRRATVSSAGDLSFSSSGGSGNSHSHAHSYSTDAVTRPISGNFASGTQGSIDTRETEATSLTEAYLSLRKVIGFLQHSSPATSFHANLVDPSQLTTLEAVLAQLRQANTSQVPTSMPSRSA